MKLLGVFGLGLLCSWLGPVPVAAHDCDRHAYQHSNGYNCDHQGVYCNQRGTRPRGSQTPGNTVSTQTIEGKVTEVVYLPGATPETANVEVRLQSGAQTYLVRLAPAGFLKQSGLALREGSSVTVRGFAVAGMEGDLFVATEIHHGDKTLNLRDARGIPAW